ncbi:MAG TPA: hypothetical protein VMV59_11390, partial [Candidatus Dormibacteraeota bacterium]|nr:hypothetical protein [Candidatus Dormibacteraeota bacterium]
MGICVFAGGPITLRADPRENRAADQLAASSATEGPAAQRIAADATSDWLERVQKKVAARNLTGALQVVNARLTAAPDDSGALRWRAQLLGWTGHRREAEAAYRRALQLSPRDADLFLGL